eukprot:3980546-Pyramimonas_sp.AAC.1
MLALTLLLGLAMPKTVDNWGHLGGVLGGSMAAWMLGPNMVRPFLLHHHSQIVFRWSEEVYTPILPFQGMGCRSRPTTAGV